MCRKWIEFHRNGERFEREQLLGAIGIFSTLLNEDIFENFEPQIFIGSFDSINKFLN